MAAELECILRFTVLQGGDMEKFLKGQAAEFEKKFASYKSQQEMEKNQLQEAKKVLEQKLELGSKVWQVDFM